MENFDKNEIKETAEKHGIRMVVLFGSRANRSAKTDSDFDVAYISEKKLNLEEESKFAFDLSKIFKSENIDMVNLREAKPLLMKQIAENSLILYEKEHSLFNEFFIYATKIYNESRILFKIREDYLNKKIASY